MPAEFMTTSTASERTYDVPAAVVASLRTVLDRPETATHPDVVLADKIATTGKAVMDDVIRVQTHAVTPSGKALWSGAADWADRVVSGYLQSVERDQQARLEKYGYDPDRFAYVGITDAENEDLITHVVRTPLDRDDLEHAEALTAGGWMGVAFDFTDEDAHTYGVGLDADMLAFTAAALIEDGDAGVLLSYGEPLLFLDAQPLLAAAVAPADPLGHVYAIVDATDTSAVMDLIMMRKVGDQPAIYRRNGGKWKLEPTLLDSFMSATPPPIVELTGPSRNQIITQVDASNANQVQADPGEDGQAEIGPGAQEQAKPIDTKPDESSAAPDVEKAVDLKGKPTDQPPGAKKPPEGREKRTPEDSEEGPNSRPPSAVTAAGIEHTEAVQAAQERHRLRIEQASAHYYTDAGYQSGFSLTAAVALADAVLERDRTSADEVRLLQLHDELVSRTAQAAARDQVLIPALTAAGANKPTTNSAPGQVKAEQLRKYWLRGKGAVKIRWGTSGDFTRCVRQLRKHLGARTEGYCARRHREANGFYPGDKRNK